MAAGREQNRWHILALYRTDAGQYVLSVEYVTRWEGEIGRSAAWVVGDRTEVATAFNALDPTAHVQEYPPDEQYAEGQARLLKWIRDRYHAQVTELVGQWPEFDERI